MEIRLFIKSLLADPGHPLINEILQHVTDEDAPAFLQLYKALLVLLQENMLADADKSVFEVGYLKRVVKQFSDEIQQQSWQRQILEAILRYAIHKHGMLPAKIPQLIKVQRDIPALAPVVLMHAVPAVALFNVLHADLADPAKLNSSKLELGRLVAVLFLIEGVPDLTTVANVLQSYELCYADSVQYLSPIKKDVADPRYIIQLYTALLFQLFRRSRGKNDETALTAQQPQAEVKFDRKSLLDYVTAYIGHVMGNRDYRLTSAQLINYRNIYWTSNYSPVEAKFYLQRCKSTVLPEPVFIRLLTDKCKVQYSADTDIKKGDWLDVAKRRLNLCDKANDAQYQSVKTQESLVKHLITQIKKPKDGEAKPGMHFNNVEDEPPLMINPKKPRETLIKLICHQLNSSEYEQIFYVYLFGSWLVDLLQRGGIKKKLLEYKTIRDYATAPLNAFMIVFADLHFLQLDEEELTEKLNEVAQLMTPTRRGSLYYLAVFIQNLDLVPDFLASSLDIRSESSAVNANIISVPQTERLLEHLSMAGDYTDAILLFCFGFYTGTRRSEAKFIRVSDFDLLERDGQIHISIKNVPTRVRGLKSRAGTRTVQLNAFWPQRWLALLAQKNQRARINGFTLTSRLFDGNVDELFAFISKLVRGYLHDDTFRYHNLRHSFVCWQYYRLLLQPRLTSKQVALPRCLAHNYFADSTCQAARQYLGLPVITRKLVYALSAIVGHSDPQITFGSYHHLRDLYSYLLVANCLNFEQKALSRLVSRATLDSKLANEYQAGAITYSHPYDEQTLRILPSKCLSDTRLLSCNDLPIHQNVNLPTLQQIEFALLFIGKLQSDDNTAVAIADNLVKIEGAWLGTLHDTCKVVRRDYPRRSKRLRLLPVIPMSKEQLRADKSISFAREVFQAMRSKAQRLIDSKKYSDEDIISVLETLKGLLIAQAWCIQFKQPDKLADFLAFSLALVPEGIKAVAVIYLPLNEQGEPIFDDTYSQWLAAFEKAGIKPGSYDIEVIDKNGYWFEKLKNSLVWLHFASPDIIQNRSIRVRAVMEFLHFLLVACKTRLQLNSVPTEFQSEKV
ncbi:hypothetical protein ORJ04_18525 [Rheinheimera baltica]|uniref:Tyr recombinase domain-containing protein n=1 Tax=Rheinheimera baltica TaxID=67576 RepID=A0ABT9I3I5_9GAMM|nr:hypothetical protein [Rheinheimera baltica]MDP5137950.1 hypothetical protein [Rheinheimera baltica]